MTLDELRSTAVMTLAGPKGTITLAVVLATVLATSVWVSRAHVPAEGVEQR